MHHMFLDGADTEMEKVNLNTVIIKEKTGH